MASVHRLKNGISGLQVLSGMEWQSMKNVATLLARWLLPYNVHWVIFLTGYRIIQAEGEFHACIHAAAEGT